MTYLLIVKLLIINNKYKVNKKYHNVNAFKILIGDWNYKTYF